MKIITNNDQLEIKTSAMGAVILAIIFALIGIGTLCAPLFVQNTPSWLLFVGIGGLVIGVLAILSASSRVITLRRSGTSEIVTTKLIGGKTTAESFDRSQLVSVELMTSNEQSTTRNSDGSNSTNAQLVSNLYLLLNTNAQVQLASETKQTGGGLSINGMSTSSITNAPLSEEAQTIASFFGVPLNSRTSGQPSFQDFKGAIEAVREAVTSSPEPTPQQQPTTQTSVQSPSQTQLPSQPVQTASSAPASDVEATQSDSLTPRQ